MVNNFMNKSLRSSMQQNANKGEAINKAVEQGKVKTE
jgi:hypothetical protein